MRWPLGMKSCPQLVYNSFLSSIKILRCSNTASQRGTNRHTVQILLSRLLFSFGPKDLHFAIQAVLRLPSSIRRMNNGKDAGNDVLIRKHNIFKSSNSMYIRVSEIFFCNFLLIIEQILYMCLTKHLFR